MAALTLRHAEAIKNLNDITNKMEAESEEGTMEERLALMHKSFDASNALSDIEAEMSGIPRLSPEELKVRVQEMKAEIFYPLMAKVAQCAEDVDRFASGEMAQWQVAGKEIDAVSRLLDQRGLKFSIIRQCSCLAACEHSASFVKC